MNRFLDTCVVIAYCFPTHKFNDRCKEITKIKKIWVSDNVLIEWNKKECEVIYDHNAAILEHINYIQLNFKGDIKEDSKNNLVAYSPEEIQQFTEIFYNKIGFPIPANDLCDILNDIYFSLRNATKRKHEELASIWEVHIRDKDYPDQERSLETYAHDEDIYILIDAHDLSLKISPHPLKFLTTDEGLWKNRPKIVRALKIYEIKDLKRESALS